MLVAVPLGTPPSPTYRHADVVLIVCKSFCSGLSLNQHRDRSLYSSTEQKQMEGATWVLATVNYYSKQRPENKS
ncbi:hypothetical protein U1Q18_029810 [Sarracenia purpurea var. burkii]